MAPLGAEEPLWRAPHTLWAVLLAHAVYNTPVVGRLVRTAWVVPSADGGGPDARGLRPQPAFPLLARDGPPRVLRFLYLIPAAVVLVGLPL